MKRFANLYVKEIEGNWLSFLAIPAFILVVSLWIVLRRAPQINSLVVGVIFFLVVWNVIAGINIVFSLKIFSREWSNNTIYYILNLPLRGYTIVGTKLAAVLTSTIVAYVALIIPFIFFFLGHLRGFNINLTPESYMTIIKIILIYWGYIIMMFALGVFSTVTGKLARKFTGLLSFIVFMTGGWVIGKVLEWVGNIAVFNTYMVVDESTILSYIQGAKISLPTISLNPVYFITVFTISILLFIGASLLVERRIEV